MDLPVITAQPQPQTAFVGANVNLRVSATSSQPLRYRWRFHGTNLPNNFPGQSTPLLTLREVTTAASGPYSVVVSNNFGAVTSQTAVVTVNQFSGRAVGYVNLNAVPGYSLFAVPLAQYETNQAVPQQIPAAVDGASLFKLDGNGFTANNFLDGWSDTNMILTLGEGWFFHNPGTDPFGFTLVGGVMEGWVTNSLPAGHAICANIIPQTGRLTSDFDFPATPGTKIFLFDENSQSYLPHEATEMGWQPSEPVVSVAEAFWVREPHAEDWVRYFTVTPFVGFGDLNLSSGIAQPALTAEAPEAKFFTYDFNPFAVVTGSPPGSYRIVQPTLTAETAEVNFFTYQPNGGLGRVLDLDGVTAVTNDFYGQLYASTNDTETALTPIGTPVLFLNGAGAGYIRSGTVKLPGMVGGQSVFLQLRVWEKCAGDTYEQAVVNCSASGRSAVFTVIGHATIENGGPGLPPRNANTFPAFQVSPGPELPVRVARIGARGGNVEICFATLLGRVYCLQKAPLWAEPMVWTAVTGAEMIPGTGHVVMILDSIGAQQSLYRVSRVQ